MINRIEYRPENKPMHKRAFDVIDWACQMIMKRTDLPNGTGTKCPYEENKLYPYSKKSISDHSKILLWKAKVWWLRDFLNKTQYALVIKEKTDTSKHFT